MPIFFYMHNFLTCNIPFGEKKLEAKTSKRRWHGSVLVFRKQCCHPFPQSAFVRPLLLENCFGSGIATAWCSLRGQEMSLFEIQTSTCVLHLVHVLGCFDFATHYATLKGTPNRKADMAEGFTANMSARCKKKSQFEVGLGTEDAALARSF